MPTKLGLSTQTGRSRQIWEENQEICLPNKERNYSFDTTSSEGDPLQAFLKYLMIILPSYRLQIS